VKTPASVQLRRARPYLGTLVEITARGSNDSDVMQAIDDAFSAIARTHRLMSFHEHHSDVSRINREAHRRAVRVHPWTWNVLREAQHVASESRGLFDITIASNLVRRRLLPGTVFLTRNARAARFHDVCLLPGHRVRFARPLLVDLGGIAKGFAVDQAIASLRRANMRSGLVNAGGDLRVFGDAPQLIHVRHPTNPGRLLPMAELRSGALATSANYFSPGGSSIVDPRRNLATTCDASVSVAAGRCVTADAWTKVLMIGGSRTLGLLRRAGAIGFILRSDSIAEVSPR
jgi:thiamine biosynthesis lipoprotein